MKQCGGRLPRKKVGRRRLLCRVLCALLTRNVNAFAQRRTDRYYLRRQTVGDAYERTVKILADRKKSVGLQLAERESELLFYSVNCVKEVSAVYS
jgi:hypothetical protein